MFMIKTRTDTCRWGRENKLNSEGKFDYFFLSYWQIFFLVFSINPLNFDVFFSDLCNFFSRKCILITECLDMYTANQGKN